MFDKLLKTFLACLFAVFLVASGLFSAPALALVTDPTKAIPERFCQGQAVCYFKVTVNFNDPRIASGVWFDTLPKNAFIISIDAQVTTAFNAGTTNVLTVGATPTSNEIVASGITAGTVGIYHLTTAAGLGNTVTNNPTYQTQLNGVVPVYVKYAQTGTAATAGSVTIVIAFAKDNDR